MGLSMALLVGMDVRRSYSIYIHTLFFSLNGLAPLCIIY